VSDRLALAHAIEDAGIPREKAEGMATAIARFVEGNVATKADVQASEARLRAEINATEAALHTLVASEAARLDAGTSGVRADLVLVEHRLMTRLGGLAVVLSGIIIAALHLWQPHP
jgi:hypothetical protein